MKKEHQFIARLEECMREQIYLNPRLTLQELALRVGTNRTYLSRYINREKKQTFFDYLNTYRLGYAVELLTHTNLTLEVIAERSGFNSLSTFRRFFQQTYGTSPSAYKKEHTAN